MDCQLQLHTHMLTYFHNIIFNFTRMQKQNKKRQQQQKKHESHKTSPWSCLGVVACMSHQVVPVPVVAHLRCWLCFCFFCVIPHLVSFACSHSLCVSLFLVCPFHTFFFFNPFSCMLSPIINLIIICHPSIYITV